ncbi:MAG: diguanylate cyclase (GGDEF)-like protein [Glaciecola sp.]|jgi:diguanylate cyclase (GGDEF)-like protein
MSAKRQQTIRLFSYIQFGIVLLFTLVVIFAIVRITELGKILDNLTDKTIPKMTQASSLINQVQELATLTTILSISENSPGLQLSNRKIQQSIQKINVDLLNRSSDGRLLTTQFSTITKESDELSDLVKQRIAGERALLAIKNKLNALILRDLKNMSSSESNAELENNFLNLFLLTGKIEQQSRLHEIRQIEDSLAATVTKIKINLAAKNKNELVDIANLEFLLLGQDGLINQKVKSLRIIGRTLGRANFVRNLIADIASNLEYQNFVANRAIIQKARKVNELAAQYSMLTMLAGVISILLTLSLIYFLYKRIVVRLLSLSLQVKQASKDNEIEITMQGNDEIATLANTFSTYLNKVKEQEKALLNMTLTDPLTGIPNRRAFEQKLADTIDLAARNHWCVSVILIDVDFFKLYNDHYGHSDGDVCLRLVAKKLLSIVSRKSDFCGRFGGEEFVCVLPDTGVEGAHQISEMLRGSIESLKIPHIKSSISDVITISLGAATLSFGKDAPWSKDMLILEADKALYRAKAEGRNRCQYFSINADSQFQ